MIEENQPKSLPASPQPPSSPPASAITTAVVAIAIFILSVVLIDPTLTGKSANGLATGNSTTGSDVVTGSEIVEVKAVGLSFVPHTITVAPQTRLRIKLTNTDTMVHDLVFENGATSQPVSPGASTEFEVGVISSNTEGWCSIPGHRAAGMVLHVNVIEEDGVTSDQTPPNDGGHHHSDTSNGVASMADFLHQPSAQSVDPVAPAFENRTGSTTHRYELRVSHQTSDLGAGLQRTIWTFNGGPVAPVLRGKVGDEFIVTVKNDSDMDHSIDFHASEIAPDRSMVTIPPGHSHEYRFTAARSGIWMYHCSTMPMSMHIAAGMVGVVIIDPADLDPVSAEYVLVQSEIYPEVDHAPSATSLRQVQPDYLAFNGIPFQYHTQPLTVKVGERIRIWVLAAGPNLGSSFHVVGAQFSTVWTEGHYTVRGNRSESDTTTGAQVLPLAPAQGGFVELEFVEPGNYSFVDHSMSRAEQGASGRFHVTP